MVGNEWLFESQNENGDKLYFEGTYDDEHMHILQTEKFVDLINENQKNEEEIYHEDSQI